MLKCPDSVIASLITHAYYNGGPRMKGVKETVMASIIEYENPGILESTDKQMDEANERFQRVMKEIIAGPGLREFLVALKVADAFMRKHQADDK